MFKINNKSKFLSTPLISNKEFVLNDIRRMPNLYINGEDIKNIEENFLRMHGPIKNNRVFLEFIVDLVFKNSSCNELIKIDLELFLIRYLHQAGIYYQNIKAVVQTLANRGYMVIDTGIDYQFDLTLEENTLVIFEKFSIKEYREIENMLQPIVPIGDNNFFMQGNATYRVFVKDDVIHYKIENSTIECVEKKFQPFFTGNPPL